MAIALLGTLDTKGCEIAFLKACLLELRTGCDRHRCWSVRARWHRAGHLALRGSSRRGRRSGGAYRPPAGPGDVGHGASAPARCCAGCTLPEGLEGALGMGGNQGTAIVCAGLRELPLGLPEADGLDRSLGQHASLRRRHRYRGGLLDLRSARRDQSGHRARFEKRCRRHGRDEFRARRFATATRPRWWP